MVRPAALAVAAGGQVQAAGRFVEAGVGPVGKAAAQEPVAAAPMVPVVQPANSPKGVGRDAARST
jgi:hypothetical protein